MDSDKIAHDIAMLYLSRQYDEIKSNNKELFMLSVDYIGLANVLRLSTCAFIPKQ